MKILLFLLFSCFFYLAKAQSNENISINGYVKNDFNNTPIEGASVTLKQGHSFLTYAFTNNKGYYQLTLNKTIRDSTVVLEVNSLGFHSYKKNIKLENKRIENNVLLFEKIENLNTVVIKSIDKIEINRDTIAYKLSAFNNGSEKNVEDILKNLPGIEIDNNGNIKALGKHIQKILIEGDDLANKNYKIISKNLDAEVIKSVEIINNYDENPVLKQFLNSDNVVLNLKLKDNKKSLLFGKADAGFGMKNRYLGDINLGLFNPKFKFLNLGFINNIGRFADNQFNNYQYKSVGFNDFDKSFDIQQNPLIYLKGSEIELENKNYIQNQSLSNSLLFNKKFSNKLKLKNTLYTYKDRFNKDYKSKSTYFVQPLPVEITEQNKFDNKNFSIGNNLELQYTPSRHSNLLFKNEISITNTNDLNNVITNNEIVNQQLENKSKILNAQTQYTKKTKKGVLVLNGFVGLKNLDQLFLISPNNFLDNTDSNSRLFAKYNSSFNYYGIESVLVYKKNSSTYSFTSGISGVNESITAKVSNNTSIIDSLSNVNSTQNIKPKFQFKLLQPIIKNLSLNTNVNSEINLIKKGDVLSVHFLPNFDIDLTLKKTKWGNYKIGFNHTSEMPFLDKYLNYFIVKNYRRMLLGAKDINVLNRNRYFVSHSYSNIKKRLFYSTSISYYHNKKGFTSITNLNNVSNISRLTYIEGQKTLFFNTNYTTYIDAIDMSLKFSFQNMYSMHPNYVNNETLHSKNNRTSYIISGTSYFKSLFNFRFLLNYVTNNGKNSNIEVKNNQFKLEIDATFKFHENWLIKLTSNNILMNRQFYDTNEFEIKYKPKSKNWSLGLRSQNIFNNKNYIFSNITDYRETDVIFEAVPGYGLIYGSIRF